jgi:hypothetical protein
MLRRVAFVGNDTSEKHIASASERKEWANLEQRQK